MVALNEHHPAARDGTVASRVVLVSHSRDQDSILLTQALLRRGVEGLLWLFDARDEEMVVDAMPGQFTLQRGAQVLSSQILGGARAVILRTGLGDWDRPIASTGGSSRERQFADREWADLVHGLMVDAEQRYLDVAWINRPSLSKLVGEKYHLLSTAELDGLQVPSFRVSTEGLLPPSVSGGYVCKPINQDENVDERRVFGTAPVDRELVASFRTNCPSLVQERVEADCELRVYYLLGELLCLRVVADTRDYADIRLLPRASLSIDRAVVPPSLKAAIARYCDRHRLSYCAFDFLRTADGQDLLIDVNPAGSWSFYETPEDPVVTEWYADTISRAIAR